MPVTPRGWAQWYGNNEQRVHRRRWTRQRLYRIYFANLKALVIVWTVRISAQR